MNPDYSCQNVSSAVIRQQRSILNNKMFKLELKTKESKIKKKNSN